MEGEIGMLKIVDHINENRLEEVREPICTAFEQYVNQGLHVTCAFYTKEDVKNILQSDFYLIALTDTNEIVGFTSCYECDKHIYNGRVTAVSPNAQKMGVGMLLQQERKKRLENHNCRYLISSTSIFEKPSIKWHLNKRHCHIIGFYSYKDTNYYSYIFREDILEKSTFFDIHVKYPIRFIKQFIKTMLFLKKNGSCTILGNLYSSIRNK